MRKNKATSVLVADDHYYSIESLKLALAHEKNIVLCGAARSGSELLRLCQQFEPDVIITDVRMPDMSGIEITRIIRTQYPQIKIIGWTGYRDSRQLLDMINAGANGYISKNTDSHYFGKAVETVMRGLPYYCEVTSEHITELLRGEKDYGGPRPLPPGYFAAHEKEILILICRGYKTGAIAAELRLSKNTVNKYRANLKFKTGAATIAELVTFAVEHGIIDMDAPPAEKTGF